MKYKFVDEYVSRITRSYELEIDDDCEIKMKNGNVYVDDVELYYILDELENGINPQLIKINGVRILKMEEDEKVDFVTENIFKVEGK